MEHEWRGRVARAGDGDENVVFVFLRFLVFFGGTLDASHSSEEGKGPENKPYNHIIVGLTMYVRMDHDAHMFSKESRTLHNMQNKRACILHNG